MNRTSKESIPDAGWNTLLVWGGALRTVGRHGWRSPSDMDVSSVSLKLPPKPGVCSGTDPLDSFDPLNQQSQSDKRKQNVNRYWPCYTMQLFDK